MKTLAIIILTLLPITAFAQNHPDMSQLNSADMQKMMQQIQKMQACMAKLDKSKLQAISQQSSKFMTKIKAMCVKGKRAAAQKKAVSFATKLATNKTMQSMKKCGEGIQAPAGMMPLMDQEMDFSLHHVCDK